MDPNKFSMHLLNQLQAQSGKHITASAASVLITDTQVLQASI
jgi:hypothetical protein